MAIEVPPRGTKGARIPGFLRPLMRFGMSYMLRRYRQRHGDMSMNGQPLVLLTTIGAKSGERREALVNRFPDGDSQMSWLVTATAGASATHPAWFLNMAKHPDQVWVEIEGRQLGVRVESLTGEERDAAWRRIVSLSPSFGSYPDKTDRVIPVVRLTALE